MHSNNNILKNICCNNVYVYKVSKKVNDESNDFLTECMFLLMQRYWGPIN